MKTPNKPAGKPASLKQVMAMAIRGGRGSNVALCLAGWMESSATHNKVIARELELFAAHHQLNAK